MEQTKEHGDDSLTNAGGDESAVASGREHKNDETKEAVDSREYEVEPVSICDEEYQEAGEDDLDAELSMLLDGRRQVVDSEGRVGDGPPSSAGSISQGDRQKFDTAAPADNVSQEDEESAES